MKVLLIIVSFVFVITLTVIANTMVEEIEITYTTSTSTQGIVNERLFYIENAPFGNSRKTLTLLFSTNPDELGRTVLTVDGSIVFKQDYIDPALEGLCFEQSTVEPLSGNIAFFYASQLEGMGVEGKEQLLLRFNNTNQWYVTLLSGSEPLVRFDDKAYIDQFVNCKTGQTSTLELGVKNRKIILCNCDFSLL